jgi:phosphoribosylglycinamide formyltransferase-1
MQTINICIFASGKGSNALNIVRHLETHPTIRVSFILSNKKDAPIVGAAEKLGIKVITCSNQEVDTPAFLTTICAEYSIDYIVLAGFLRKIPVDLIHKYENRMINVHPSLLPKYGGAGMYGDHVHKAVLANKEKETGITIHYVTQEFDQGQHIAQFHTQLNETDSLETIQHKIHQLEQAYFPFVIEQTILHTLS